MAVQAHQQVNDVASTISLVGTRQGAKPLEQKLKLLFQASCGAKMGFEFVEHGLKEKSCLTAPNVVLGLSL